MALSEPSSGLLPVVCERVEEVVCLEQRWKVVDLDHVTKVIRVESYVLIEGVIAVNLFYGDTVCFFEMCLNLKGQQIKQHYMNMFMECGEMNMQRL